MSALGRALNGRNTAIQGPGLLTTGWSQQDTSELVSKTQNASAQIGSSEKQDSDTSRGKMPTDEKQATHTASINKGSPFCDSDLTAF